MSDRPRPGRPDWLPTAPVRLLHVAVVWAFAVAQPIFDVLAGEPTFFISRGSEALDVLALAVFLICLGPAAAAAVEGLASLAGPRSLATVHVTLLGALSGLFFVQMLDGFGVPGGLSIAGGIALGAGAALLYMRREWPRTVLSVLAPAPLLFAALFAFTEPLSSIVRPAEVGAADVRVDSRAPVVVIVFDELPLASLLKPDGSLDRRRWPGFAELARDSTWYRRATTVAAYTPHAVPALLAGRNPPSGSPPTASALPRNLFTLLGGSHEMHVAEPITDLCPDSLCPEPAGEGFGERARELGGDLWPIAGNVLLPESVADGLFPSVDDTFGDFGEQGDGELVVGPDAFRGRAELAERFLAGMGPEPATLHLLHINLPHGTWEYLPTGEAYRPGHVATPELTTRGEGRWDTETALIRQFQQRHLLQLGYADRYLARVIAKMKRLGIWNESAVAVSADHGGSFAPGELRRSASSQNIGEVAFVPLFIKRPGETRPTVRDRRICTTEVLGKLAGTLGIEPLPEEIGECPQSVVDVDNNEAQHVELPLGEGERQLRAAVRRNARLFGTGPIGRVYEWGAAPGLIGRPGAAFATTAPRDASARVERPLRRTERWVPAFIQGPIEGVQAGTAVAAAVDGVIRGVGPAFEFRGVTRYSVVIPPAAIRGPRHRLELFAVTGEGGESRLTPLLGGPVRISAGGRP